jgi:hypothetical protein
MKKSNCLLIALVAFVAAGCSVTPGDAAYRAGHPDEAARLYSNGVEQGDAQAARKLGLLIEEGEIAESAYGASGKWFKQGCDLGDLPSCHNVGVGYEYGKSGFVKNYGTARSYYEKAAELGYMQSQYNLASLYANRYFTDDVEGYKWLLISQMQARKCSNQSLCEWVLSDPPGHKRTLEKRMSSQEIELAESEASKWTSSS